MYLDVQDLRNFYYRSMLGRAAQATIRTQLLSMWPDVTGETVAGFGFAVPVLRPYLFEARRVVALMPGPQGVMQWPAGMPNVSVLCEETNWPLETGHVDRLVVLHGLETSEQPSQLLDECWRVMGPGARAIFIVPNRAGLWARSDRTPFGFGRPYTLAQAENQLRKQRFSIENHTAALYRVPSPRRFWLKSGAMIEQVARKLPAMMAAGVYFIEVSKQIQPKKGHMMKNGARNPIRMLEGLSNPVPKPAWRQGEGFAHRFAPHIPDDDKDPLSPDGIGQADLGAHMPGEAETTG